MAPHAIFVFEVALPYAKLSSVFDFNLQHLLYFVDTESPVTSPKNEDVTFGGYSPSVGEAKERPLTAPNKRSVRFADELGLDGLDLSLNDSRPSTAPGSGRSRNANRLKDATIGSSFEDDNTDVSLELSTNEFKRPLQPTLNKKGMYSL